jgi:hypothetical protein
VRRLLAVTVGNDSPDDDPDVEVARLAGLLERALREDGRYTVEVVDMSDWGATFDVVCEAASALETARLNRWLGHRQWAPPEPSTRQQIRRAPGRRPA